MEDYKLPQETQEQVKKILGDIEDKPPLNQVIHKFKTSGYTEQKEVLILWLECSLCRWFF